MKKFNFSIVLFFCVQTLFAQVNFTDTILYPQSKGAADTSNFRLLNEGSKATIGLSQTYNANTGIIHGIRAFVLLDTNGVPSTTTKEVIISVFNVNSFREPTTLIHASAVTLFDVGTAEQTLLFDTPVAVNNKYAIALDFDIGAPGYSPVTDSLWYLCNVNTAGNQEGLMALHYVFGGPLWINRYGHYALTDSDFDAMLAPIFETTITPSYTTSTDSICLGDNVQFTNTSTFSTDYMYNRWDSLGMDPYKWDYGDGSGTYNHIDTSYTYADSGTFNSQLIITNYGYTNTWVDTVEKELVVVEAVVANTDTSVCFGDTLHLSATGALTYSWDNSLGAGANQFAFQAVDTMYVVTGTGAFSCISKDTVNVSVNALPNVITSVDTAVCLGDTVFLSATGAVAYSWDNGLGAGQFQDPIPTIDTLYVVEGTDALGCIGLDTVTVAINALPTVMASTDTSVCAGDTVFLSATGAVAYTWDNGLGAGQTQTPIGTIDTLYVVSGTDALGCVGLDTVNVAINALPNLIASTDTSVCIGDAVFLSATGAVAYTWDNGLGAGQFQDPIPTIDTLYVVEGTDGLGCVGLDTINVSVNALPNVITSVDTTVCLGDTVFLSATGAVAYSWDNGLGAGQTQTPMASIDTFYVVNGTDALGCVGLDTVNVAINALPTVMASTDTTVCAGDTVFLSATGALSYTWDNGLGAGQTQTPMGTIDTLYVVSGTDALGCVGLDTVTVEINALPVVVTSNDANICIGDSVLISAISTSPNYTWDNGLGSGQQQQVSPTLPTAYIVSTVDGNNCLGVDTLTINVNELPILTLNADTLICFGDSIVLLVDGADTYTWDNGLGTGSIHTVFPLAETTYHVEAKDTNTCVTSDSVNVIVHVVNVMASPDTSLCAGDTLFLSATGAVAYSWDNELGAGQFQDTIPTIDTQYLVAGTDALGCVGIDSVNVTVNALPVVVASNDATICIADSVLISAVSTSPNYTWDNGLGSGQQQQVFPSIPTAYIVSTVDGNNCVGLDTLTINVNAFSTLSLNTDTSICFGDSIVLLVDGADTYTWNNGLSAESTHTVFPLAETTYHVEATDTNSCVTSDSVTVTVNVVDVMASNDVTICLGSSTIISASGASLLAWNNNLGTGDEFEVAPTATANYIVVGIENGCIDADTLTVTVDQKCFNVPNVFTPNGDGKNEVWNISGLEQYPEVIVKVFNRWGDVVFESASGYTEAWDGTFNGITSSAATYYYVIELGDVEGNSTSGTINIIR